MVEAKCSLSQAYSNPERESDPHALPDIEVFYINAARWRRRARPYRTRRRAARRGLD
jgi:hypothetical protein